MKSLRSRLQSFSRFLATGPFRGQHKPIRFDEHTIATTGNDAITRMEHLEDRADVFSSADADRARDIAYYGDRAW
jgi:hypothetical protein